MVKTVSSRSMTCRRPFESVLTWSFKKRGFPLSTILPTAPGAWADTLPCTAPAAPMRARPAGAAAGAAAKAREGHNARRAPRVLILTILALKSPRRKA